MYLPAAFRVDDRATLLAHAGANPFATVVTSGPDGPAVSHLPLLVDAARGVLRGHLARESEQLAHLAAGAVAIAVFHGPHGYVSPSVYADPESVPTWNYVAVHARGHARLVDEAGLREILAATVARFETDGWDLAARREATLAPLVAAIAGFEIAIERLEGKWKLSQNRSPEDRARVADWLDRQDASSREVAALMREARRRPAAAGSADARSATSGAGCSRPRPSRGPSRPASATSRPRSPRRACPPSATS